MMPQQCALVQGHAPKARQASHLQLVCSCNHVPLDPFQHGCFPATPIDSIDIRQCTSSPPVWVALSQLDFCKLVQYRGGGEPSDANLASAMYSLHELHASAHVLSAEDSRISYELMPEDTLNRYLSVALRQRRVLDMQLRADEREARHPASQPGAPISECPICSTGADIAVLDPPPPVEAADSCASASTSQSTPLVRPVSVRCSPTCMREASCAYSRPSSGRRL